MKRSLDVTKISTAFVLAFLVSLSAQAKETVVGTLSEVKGKVFISRMGKLKEAAVSDKIYDNSEIITELSSQVTLTDYYDHRYYVSGGAHLRVSDNQVELLRGYLWVQSFNPQTISEISTANSRVYFKQAEAIISYDQGSAKTQMVVITGRAQFSHALESFRSTIVEEGRFSFIDNQVDDGTPRTGTPIGYTSFQKMTELFDGVKPLEENNVIAAQNRVSRTQANRAPASVVTTTELEHDIFAPKAAKTEKQIVKEAVTVTNSDQLLIDYYQSKINELKQKSAPTRRPAPNRAPASVSTKPAKAPAIAQTPVKVKIYGAPKQAAQTPRNVNRAPASVGGANVLAPNVNPDAFESRLVDEYARQTRHSEETLKLINDLKNYQVDFKKSY
jgi:hypothetical protein